MRELRAIVLGVVVVVLIALAWGFFRRPAPGMTRVRSFRVEIDGHDNGRDKHISVRLPGFLVGKVSQLVSHSWDNDDWRDWNFSVDGDDRRITPREILEAAEKSSPGHPSRIALHGDDDALDVSEDGAEIRVHVLHDGARREAEIVVPKLLLAGLAQEKPIRPRDILRRIDSLGPGEIISIRSEDGNVRIVAEGKDGH
ncbi:MAG: hypothetical protein ACRD16_08805 [Thermoanaerobaculia bacterium]